MNIQKIHTCRPISYDKKQLRDNGFTIVELLVVIVVIAILAVIATVSYNGIINRARESALQSDLNNTSKAIKLIHAETGRYPATSSEINNGQGLKTSEGNTLTYNVNADGTAICLQIQGYAKSYFVTESNTVPTAGVCSNYTGVPQSSEAPAPPVNGGVVTTLAGSSQGYLDGTGTVARFNTPNGIAIDTSGTIYVADSSNNRIRKISPSGVVTTFAGSTQGSADGTGTAAQFYSPSGLTVDTSGNVYVADYFNHRIRKISPSGVVTTIAGSTLGYTDGTGTAAQFNSPRDVAVDSAGNVYVSDTNNHRIRKISPSGVVTTFAGSTPAGNSDGTGTAAKFTYPYGIGIDGSENIYVADNFYHRIRKISPSGVVTTFAGSTPGYTNATGTAAQFNSPRDVAVDSAGNVYVGDYSNYRVRKIDSSRVVTTLAGSTQGNTDGTGTAAQFNSPWSVAVNAAGDVYVTDLLNHRIRKVQ